MDAGLGIARRHAGDGPDTGVLASGILDSASSISRNAPVRNICLGGLSLILLLVSHGEPPRRMDRDACRGDAATLTFAAAEIVPDPDLR
jgi:hypothetical protein